MDRRVFRRCEPGSDPDHDDVATWGYLIVTGRPLSAWANCPAGHQNVLLDHEIQPNGDVEPSVNCGSCSFHASIRLDGWDPSSVALGKG